MLSRKDSSGTLQNDEFETVGQGKIIVEIPKKCGDIMEKFSINPEHAPAFGDFSLYRIYGKISWNWLFEYI